MTANPVPYRFGPVEQMLAEWQDERPESRKWIIPEHHTREGLFTVWVFERRGETTYKSERSVSYEAPTEVRCACARLAVEALERSIRARNTQEESAHGKNDARAT